MNAQWILGGGRNIETPEGTFYLTYGSDSNGNPHFRDFVLLDKIARQVALLPEFLAALEAVNTYEDDEPAHGTRGAEVLAQVRAVLEKAK
jgi:hypothetical protein